MLLLPQDIYISYIEKSICTSLKWITETTKCIFNHNIKSYTHALFYCDLYNFSSPLEKPQFVLDCYNNMGKIQQVFSKSEFKIIP